MERDGLSDESEGRERLSQDGRYDYENHSPSLPSPPGSNRHREGRRKDRSSKRLSNRDLMRVLVENESEARQLRRAYNSALERLDSESYRANNAEQRALDQAQRLRDEIDARAAVDLELSRTKDELRMYKDQLNYAQREILRAQDVVRELEAARDDTEQALQRARYTARKLQEQRRIFIAREEGRRQGYQEGLVYGKWQGLDEGRMIGYSDAQDDVMDAAGRFDEPVYRHERPDEDENEDDELEYADGASEDLLPRVANFPTAPGLTASHSPRDRYDRPAGVTRIDPELEPAFAEPIPAQAAQFGSQSPNPSIPSPHRPIPERTATPVPIPVRNTMRSPRHPDVEIPPDGWIPELGENKRIVLPPPHELSRPSPSLSTAPLPPDAMPQRPVVRDYAYTNAQRGVEVGARAVSPRPASVNTRPPEYMSSRSLRQQGFDGMAEGVSPMGPDYGGGHQQGVPFREQPMPGGYGAGRSPVPPSGPIYGRGNEVDPTRQSLADSLRYGTPVTAADIRSPPEILRPGQHRKCPSFLSKAAPNSNERPGSPSHHRSFSINSPPQGRTGSAHSSSHRRVASSGSGPNTTLIPPPSFAPSNHVPSMAQQYLSPRVQPSRPLPGHLQRNPDSPGGETPLRVPPQTYDDQRPVPVYSASAASGNREFMSSSPSTNRSPVPVPAPSKTSNRSRGQFARPTSPGYDNWARAASPGPSLIHEKFPSRSNSPGRPLVPSVPNRETYRRPEALQVPNQTISPHRSPSGSHRSLEDEDPPLLRRPPSNQSLASHKSYAHYDRTSYVDPAFLASSENLADMSAIKYLKSPGQRNR